MNTLKRLAVGAVPALALAFAAVSGAQAQQIQCAPKAAMEQAVQKQFGDAATGEKGSNKAWNFQIYTDPADGSWSLLGEPKMQGAPKGLACYLGGGKSGYPDQVKAQDWYKQIFTAPAPAP